MPKLPSITPEKVIKALKRKGFVLDRVKVLKQAGIAKEELKELL